MFGLVVGRRFVGERARDRRIDGMDCGRSCLMDP